MAKLSLENITSTSFDIVISEMYQGASKLITVTVNGEDWWVDYDKVSENDTSVTFELTDLDPGTDYEVEVSIYYPQLWKTEPLSDWCTTTGSSGGSDDDEPNLQSAKVVVADFTQNSISVQLVGLDKDYNGDWTVIFYIYKSKSDYNAEEHFHLILQSVNGGNPQTSVVAFDGLESNTKYWIDARVYYNKDTKSKWTDFITQTTSGSVTPDKPSDFSWATEKTKDKPFKLTAAEWCDLLNHINAVREYLGLPRVGATEHADSIAYFYYPSREEKLLASMYNQIIYTYENMGLLKYDDHFVKPKDPITADKLNLLMNTINDV